MNLFMKQKILESIELVDWLHEQIHNLPIPPDQQIPCTLYYISMQHASGSLILLHVDRQAPAFALARPVYETFMRSIWYSIKATEFDREKVKNDRFPKLSEIVESMKNDVDAAPVIKHYENIKVLHSFTHGGTSQIFNHLNPSTLESSFSEADLTTLIDWNVRLSIASSLQFCHLLQAESALKTISDKVLPIYGKNVTKNV